MEIKYFPKSFTQILILSCPVWLCFTAFYYFNAPKNAQISQENTCAGVPFFNKVTGLIDLVFLSLCVHFMKNIFFENNILVIWQKFCVSFSVT